MHEPPNPSIPREDRKKTPEELYREKTWAERQARIKAQPQTVTELERHTQEKAKAKRPIDAQVKAKEREENQRWLRDYCDGVRKEMAQTTNRKKLIELGHTINAIAPYTGVTYVFEKHCKYCSASISPAINPQCPNCKSYICLNCENCFCELGNERARVPYDYKNICWKCHLAISSEINDRCSVCGWYICSNCRSCSRDCDGTYNPFHAQTSDPFLPDYPDDIS